MSDHINALQNLVNKLQEQRATHDAYQQSVLTAAQAEAEKKTTLPTQMEQPGQSQ